MVIKKVFRIFERKTKFMFFIWNVCYILSQPSMIVLSQFKTINYLIVVYPCIHKTQMLLVIGFIFNFFLFSIWYKYGYKLTRIVNKQLCCINLYSCLRKITKKNFNYSRHDIFIVLNHKIDVWMLFNLFLWGLFDNNLNKF